MVFVMILILEIIIIVTLDPVVHVHAGHGG